jgi:hypothetical protein
LEKKLIFYSAFVKGKLDALKRGTREIGVTLYAIADYL